MGYMIVLFLEWKVALKSFAPPQKILQALCQPTLWIIKSGTSCIFCIFLHKLNHRWKKPASLTAATEHLTAAKEHLTAARDLLVALRYSLAAVRCSLAAVRCSVNSVASKWLPGSQAFSIYELNINDCLIC